MRFVYRAVLALCFVAMATTQVSAQTERMFEPMKACAVGSYDSVQAFENYNADGGCDGASPKFTRRIADFRIGAYCSVIPLQCTEEAKLEGAERVRYDWLRTQVRTLPNAKECVQYADDGSWELVGVTAGNVECSPVKHGARYYDYVRDKACVMNGPSVVGCVPLPAHLAREARAVR